VSAETVVGGLVSLVYLVYTLLRPERF